MYLIVHLRIRSFSKPYCIYTSERSEREKINTLFLGGSVILSSKYTISLYDIYINIRFAKYDSILGISLAVRNHSVCTRVERGTDKIMLYFP